MKAKNILLLLLVIYIEDYLTCAELPTVYEYYTKGGIKSGLEAKGNYFKLNGKELRILSGSLHYFRVLPDQWKDRLLKMKAVGLNAVQLYSPWNLHEEHPGEFNFENELDLDRFLTEVKKMDMLAVYRPGPYICAEWENGGIPAWLLRDPKLTVRTNYGLFMNATANYFNKLAPIIKKHLFQNGGSIIAIQLENEYASFGHTNKVKGDLEYMKFLNELWQNAGINSLFFTCDNNYPNNQDHGSIPGMLKSANFWSDPDKQLTALKTLQPDRPQYVSEFWSGWFTFWGANYERRSAKDYQKFIEIVLFEYNASVNHYMFFGGTNFGFMNSLGVITSYDYDAPLTEAGDYGDKFFKTKEIIEKLETQGKIPKFKRPSIPKLESKGNYGLVNISQCLSFDEILKKINPISSAKPLQMEMINLNGKNYGQNFGFIHYQAKVNKFKQIKFENVPKDRTIIFVDNNLVQTIGQNDEDFLKNNMTVNTNSSVFHQNQSLLNILVENIGRPDDGGGYQPINNRRGINGAVFTDGHEIVDWKIFPLEFKKDFVNNLSNAQWKSCDSSNSLPAIYKANLVIKDKPKDTFLKYDGWTKGNAFINGFNVGRYWYIGPQKTLYIPAPLLKTGSNDIYLFETKKGLKTIEFVDKPILG